MTIDLGIALLLIFLELIILFYLGTLHNLKAIRNTAAIKREGMTKYGREMFIGISSGAIVLTVDKLLTMWGNGFSNIVFPSNALGWIETFISVVVASMLIFTFLFLAVTWFIRLGLPLARDN